MHSSGGLLGFLYQYARLMHDVVKAWIELRKGYSDELEAMSDPARLAEILREVDDREAGRLFRALLELADVSQRLSKINELELEELQELEEKLRRVCDRLEELTKEG